MSLSAISGLADNLLFSLIGGSISAKGTVDFKSLFLPPQASSATTDLSTAELISHLSTVRGSLLGLSTAATPLDLSNPTSVFFAATVSSSNGSYVQGDVRPGTSLDTTPSKATYSFTVSQLARAQANVGSSLSSSATSSFTSGTNTARFVQKGVTTDVSFTVGASDTNLSVLTSFASAVNDAEGLYVTASVRTDAVGGTSQLILESGYTGTTYTFTVSDQANTPVTAAGVGSASTAAQNASFTQNGIALTSNTNDFYLETNGSVKVTLLAATSDEVVLSIAADKTQVSNAISGLASAVNAARGFFDAYQSLYPSIASQLHSAVLRNRALLANIGVSVGDGGGLSVDSTKLGIAISQYPSSVHRAIGDPGGLAPEVRSLADTHLQNPLAVSGALPPLQAGYGPQVFAGAFAKRVESLRTTGLLVDALI